MKIYDLNKLVKDPKQLVGKYVNQGFTDTISTSGTSIGDSLYNFFDPTFKMNIGINLQQHTVAPEEEMRIDLVCKSVYNNSVDEVDFLLDLNDIDNPLNIMAGDLIYYAVVTAIPEYRITVIDNNDVRAKLLNANKSTRKDSSRKKYVDSNYALPPTFTETPTPPVKIENNQIIIG